MIEPNELRIGNYLSFDGEMRIIGYAYIECACLKRIGVKNEYLDHIKIGEGFPLTPEILEKCGFNVANNHPLEGFYYDHEAKLLEMNLDGEFYKLPHIKHLHQLQNLYFALTGDELDMSALDAGFRPAMINLMREGNKPV